MTMRCLGSATAPHGGTRLPRLPRIQSMQAAATEASLKPRPKRPGQFVEVEESVSCVGVIGLRVSPLLNLIVLIHAPKYLLDMGHMANLIDSGGPDNWRLDRRRPVSVALLKATAVVHRDVLLLAIEWLIVRGRQGAAWAPATPLLATGLMLYRPFHDMTFSTPLSRPTNRPVPLYRLAWRLTIALLWPVCVSLLLTAPDSLAAPSAPRNHQPPISGSDPRPIPRLLPGIQVLVPLPRAHPRRSSAPVLVPGLCKCCWSVGGSGLKLVAFRPVKSW